MATLLALDPGLSTGWAEISYGDHLADVVDQGVIPDGVHGFKKWWSNRTWAQVVSEKFIIAPGTVGEGWSLQVEGALIALYDGPITFQSRSDKADLVSGTEVERFAWLRSHGFTGSSHELDAITHGLLWLKRQRHQPTIRQYWLRGGAESH